MRLRIAAEAALTGNRGKSVSTRLRLVPLHMAIPSPPSSTVSVPTVSGLIVCRTSVRTLAPEASGVASAGAGRSGAGAGAIC